MARYILVVESNCADPAREAEFNEWYDKTHLPDILETPGFVRATRYENTEPAAGKAAPSPPKAPGSVTVEPAEDGAFSLPLELSEGRWTIAVTATSREQKTTTVTRAVTVQFKGVNLVVSIKNGRAWLKVWVDGKASEVTGPAGRVYGDGKVLTFTGKERIEVRTGQSSSTYFTLNGGDVAVRSSRSASQDEPPLSRGR